jgi:predicted NBD/HSP70 family sugar kinase
MTGQGGYSAGPQSLLRSINARAVLELIDKQSPISRTDVARLTGLSKPTVSVTLAALVDVGVVHEVGHVTGRKGPAAVLYAIIPTTSWGIGVDLGHDRVRVAIADLNGVTRARKEAGIRRDPEALVQQVLQMCQEAAAEVGTALGESTHVVVGLPAVVGPDGRQLSYAGGLPGAGVGLGEALAATLPTPLVLENDVNLAALSEHTQGHGVDVDDFVLVSLGVGLGVGLVVGGRVIRGASGAAGEVGYLPGERETALHAKPPLNRDLVESSIGARYIVSQARAKGLDGEVSARSVFDQARDGNADALEIVDGTARAIAYVISCIAPVVDPKLVILGGAIGSNADLLAAPVGAHLETLSPFRPSLKFSELGSEAVLLGALARARDLARRWAFDTFTPV